MRISRPPQLFGLFASTTDLPGIGARLAEILKKRIGTTVIDILRHLPVSIINRQISLDLDACENGQIVTVDAEIKSADIPPANTSRPARIVARTSHHNIELIFFHARADYLKKMLPIGERRLISGRLDRYDGKLQIGHPDYMLSPEQAHTMPKIEPVYPLSAGLKPKILRNAIAAGLKRVPALEEWIPAELLTQKGWPDFASAMNMAHHPEKEADLMAHAPARARLAYDELLANQIALHMIRRQIRHDEAGRTLKSAGTLREQIIHSLPYEMTGAQKRVMSEILADMSAPTRMLRLLQGDVGAGKTLIALLAMVEAAEAGTQAALLAPTEILAKQHFETISAILADTPLSTGLLIGAMKASDKTCINEQLKSGEMQIIIGTHALLSDDVAFADLGLAVVDEQHRFGVRQRLVLGQKGKGTDVLVMTATPIPRTLSMTAYGDLTTSYLDEKPKGRQEIKTALVSQDRIDDVITRLKGAVASGGRAYWICPLVEDSELSDYEAAESRHQLLSRLMPEAKPTLAHGKMKPAEREMAMAAFSEGTSQLLVATTVIEVGVDVPEASIIIIEHAERFGLAQLHQLRGRVGRGNTASSCLLLYKGPLSETAQSRLNIMRQTNDGFLIAEEDLRLRGPGEVLGQRQSGLPEFSLADLAEHAELIALARTQANSIIEADTDLSSDNSARYRQLISLFEKDVAVQFLASG